jgi:hypothetical protein
MFQTVPSRERLRIFGHFDDGYCITSPKHPPAYEDIDFTAREISSGESKRPLRPTSPSHNYKGQGHDSLKRMQNRAGKISQSASASDSPLHAPASLATVIDLTKNTVSAIQRAQQALEEKLGSEYY